MSRSKISKTKRERILQRDNYTCQICRKKVTNETSKTNEQGMYIYPNNYYNIDHIIPISKGGSNKDENLRIVCKECNSRKNNRQINDYINLYKSMIIDFEKRADIIDDAIKTEGKEEYLKGLEEIKNLFNQRIDSEIKRVVK